MFYRQPQIECTFTTLAKQLFTVNSANFGGDIVSIKTEKSLDKIAGTFQITMVARKNFLEFIKAYGNNVTNLGLTRPQISTVYDIFKPTTLVTIAIDGKQVMVGTIESVQKTTAISPQNGQPQRTFVLSGQDFGAQLERHKIWYDDAISSDETARLNESLLKDLSIYGVIQSDNFSKIIEKIINVWMYKVVNQTVLSTVVGTVESQLKYADGSKIHERLVCLSHSTDQATIEGSSDKIIGPGAISEYTYSDFYPTSFSMLSNNSNLFQYIQTIVSAPFNEVFVDTGDTDFILSNPRSKTGTRLTQLYDYGSDSMKTIVRDEGVVKTKAAKDKCYLVVRPAPYDDELLGVSSEVPSMLRMQDLPLHTITDNVITQKQLGLSGTNTPSSYLVVPIASALLFGQARYFVPPLYDEKALRKYGYNPLEVGLSGASLSDTFKKQGLLEICEAYQYKLRSWYQHSDKFLRGSFTIKGNSDIRIGTRLQYGRTENGDIEDVYEEGFYYITGVAHDWQFSGSQSFKTTLVVDRGVSAQDYKEVF